MSRGLALFGASAFAFLGAIGEVEAKKVYYEIDGQRYSYSTNNRQQTREAQARIAAAKARAAQPAAGPLFGGFGSRPPAQAVEIPAASPEAVTEAGTVEKRARSRASRAERRSKAREARAERLRQRREALAARREAIARERRARIEARRADEKATAEREAVVAKAGGRGTEPPEPARKADAAKARGSEAPEPARAAAAEARRAEPVAAVPVAAEPERMAAIPSMTAPEPLATQSISVATVKTISFDLTSGIKTIQMTDGTLHEEPFESGTVAALGLTSPALERSLRSFVEQLRTSRREEGPPAR